MKCAFEPYITNHGSNHGVRFMNHKYRKRFFFQPWHILVHSETDRSIPQQLIYRRIQPHTRSGYCGKLLVRYARVQHPQHQPAWVALNNGWGVHLWSISIIMCSLQKGIFEKVESYELHHWENMIQLKCFAVVCYQLWSTGWPHTLR